MPVSFPKMGYSYIAFKDLFQRLGHEVIVPPKPNDETLSLGTQYSPEFACVPYKIVLGTFIQTLKQGADILVTTGGNGPCRAGHYAQLHKRILTDMGYSFTMVILELPRRNFRYFLEKLKILNKANLSVFALIDAFKHTWAKLQALDNWEKLLHYVRPREVTPGSADRIFKEALIELDTKQSLRDIYRTEQEYVSKLKGIPLKDFAPLKLGMVGEIYVLLEPYANLEIEQLLGSLGVEVDRSLFLTGWTKDNTLTDTLGQVGGKEIKKAAAPYLSEMIGGHGQDSIGHAVIYAQRGYDGMVHLSPFTCIPEIVAKSIMPKIWEDLDFPVLSIACDELSGRAGLETRIEAFVDMLWQRRKVKGGVVNG